MTQPVVRRIALNSYMSVVWMLVVLQLIFVGTIQGCDVPSEYPIIPNWRDGDPPFFVYRGNTHPIAAIQYVICAYRVMADNNFFNGQLIGISVSGWNDWIIEFFDPHPLTSRIRTVAISSDFLRVSFIGGM
jgi:hypothetical protein